MNFFDLGAQGGELDDAALKALSTEERLAYFGGRAIWIAENRDVPENAPTPCGP